MSAPVVADPPELPTFPPGPGLPDQPGVFIPKFLLYLAWFTTFRAYLVELITYFEGLSSGGASDGGGGTTDGRVYMPLVNGSIPPVFVQNSDGSLIYVRVE